METTVKSLNWFIRLDGLVLVILGICFWTGNALGLVQLHMALGTLLVVALFVLAIIAALQRAAVGKVVLAFVWGAVVLWIGMAQITMDPGASHWVVQVVHLILGLGAIGVAQSLVSSIPVARHAA